MYRTTQIRIEQGHPLYDWCHTMCRTNNDMYNSALYVLRNVITALDKKPEDRHEKEQEVLDDIQAALSEMNCRRNKNKTPFTIPSEDEWHVLGYAFLDAYFKVIRHPAYYAAGFPTQSAQQAIRQACDDVDSFWKSIVAWKRNPSVFTGKPNMPRYKHKGGISTATITNQDANIIRTWVKGQQAYELKLPKLDLRITTDNPDRKTESPSCMGSGKNRLYLGRHEPSGKLFQVEVIPKYNEYFLSLTYDDGVNADEMQAKIDAVIPTRIAWIDPGVNRLVAAVTNCGGDCLLISGGPLKSVNQWYDKQFARIQSDVMRGGENKKEGNQMESRKFVMTDEAHKLLRYRDAYVSDFLYKAVARVIDWCVENRIDTLGMNYNSDWKNDCKMRHESKQMFMELPFARFRDILSFRCFASGIKFLTVEESYTSKASFLDGDYIPTFGCDDAIGWRSSGCRVERGLFRSSDGTVIHADLNGAANGLRKYFPDAFEREGAVIPDFSRVRFLRHPDAGLDLLNRMIQIEKNDYSHVSRSRLRRERRKTGTKNVGILQAHGSKRLYVVQSDRAL